MPSLPADRTVAGGGILVPLRLAPTPMDAATAARTAPPIVQAQIRRRLRFRASLKSASASAGLMSSRPAPRPVRRTTILLAGEILQHRHELVAPVAALASEFDEFLHLRDDCTALGRSCHGDRSTTTEFEETFVAKNREGHGARCSCSRRARPQGPWPEGCARPVPLRRRRWLSGSRPLPDHVGT